MTTPTPIACPDCEHSIVWNGNSWHDEGKSNNVGCTERGCKCRLSQQQALEKFVEQDRAETRRAALLEAAKACCYNCRTGVYKLVFLDDSFFHVRASGERIARCDAWPIHALLAQEQPEVVK